MEIITTLKFKIARLYWRIFKPKTLGVRLLLIKDNKILVVKHTYLSEFYIPGGGVKTGELFENALRRELKEELKANLGQLRLFGIYQNIIEGKHDTVVVFLGNAISPAEEFICDKKEIEQVAWFDIYSLPENISAGSKRRIDEFLKKDFPCVRKW